jgi:hypothetical protein
MFWEFALCGLKEKPLLFLVPLRVFSGANIYDAMLIMGRALNIRPIEVSSADLPGTHSTA